ncbi:hypothetical protein G4B88_001093 [Cannabis sativa]|uniref:Ty3-gypsy retrotransposon protein n=1 Tax=Cannabis sativa TaxID=3483 RepID=A0A7J6DK88_CANSA|nr:hypothetical protein G4B88_001093 [Cannabis sativa]
MVCCHLYELNSEFRDQGMWMRLWISFKTSKKGKEPMYRYYSSNCVAQPDLSAGAKKTSTRTSLANSTTKVGKLTSSEIQHIQQKGLCFRYDDKWSLGHCWKKRKLQVIIVLEDVEENGFDNETKDDGVDAIELDTIEVHKSIEVSYQFVTGLSSNSTMKLKGQLGTKKVVILINSKATHNFISKSLVTKLHIPIVETKANEVTMGNGDSMKCEGICENLNIHFQRVDIWDDFLPLPLGSADIILGLQWLTTLGMTKTNLTEQTMEFQLGEQSVTIRGNSSLDRSLAIFTTIGEQCSNAQGQNSDLSLKNLHRCLVKIFKRLVLSQRLFSFEPKTIENEKL